MAFSTKASEAFGRVIESAAFSIADPVVKCRYISKGSNLILGRTGSDLSAEKLILLGKVLESCPSNNMLAADVWLDVSFPHVIYISGTRGSGKSFDLGVLIEGISSLATPTPIQQKLEPITSILLDTQNQFWTLKYEPKSQIPEHLAQLKDLQEWRIAPNSLANVELFSPKGASKLIGTETEFSIRPRDVEFSEWCALLGQEVYSPQGHVLRSALARLSNTDFSIADLLRDIGRDSNWPGISENTRNAVKYKLDDYEHSGLFDVAGLEISTLLKPGKCNVFMVRELSDSDKSLVAAIIAKALFRTMGDYHSKRKLAKFRGDAAFNEQLPSRVWLLIDEAHVVAGKDTQSPARDALVEFVKRGRDAGLSLVLATQQPSAVDDRILSQINLSFNHRLTFQNDVASAISRVPTKIVSSMRTGGVTIPDFGDMLRYLDSGDCFIGDQSTSRTMLVKIRPRVTAHGGYSPT
ncbi:ATP-binding protein [Variovorax sp. Root318D1]|uniref:ATP-binding protein n=1 Tax=Variovorax sp. Root318D1 TaxID=1736513 RepID=UPI0009E7F3C2|nr:ATP-binding protein [Variovorax sp. Root318D1]